VLFVYRTRHNITHPLDQFSRLSYSAARMIPKPNDTFSDSCRRDLSRHPCSVAPGPEEREREDSRWRSSPPFPLFLFLGGWPPRGETKLSFQPQPQATQQPPRLCSFRVNTAPKSMQYRTPHTTHLFNPVHPKTTRTTTATTTTESTLIRNNRPCGRRARGEPSAGVVQPHRLGRGWRVRPALRRQRAPCPHDRDGRGARERGGGCLGARARPQARECVRAGGGQGAGGLRVGVFSPVPYSCVMGGCVP